MSFRRLPPFQSLVAFEASARHHSFKKAAEELFLTPPAITYRIKELESLLGISLFYRTSRGLTLTPTGQDYYQAVSQSLNDILLASEHAAQGHKERQLKIQMLPFLATEIVIPRLADFYDKYPDIDIQIDTKYALADFHTEQVDLAIRFGLGTWEDLHSEKLMPATICIVCSSNYAKKCAITKLDDLSRSTLITLDNERYNWELFANYAGIGKLKPLREIHFNDYTLCLKAAENHMGVTFGILPMIQQWLDLGRLVRPMTFAMEIPQAYYLVSQANSEKKTEIALFCDWLKQILLNMSTSGLPYNSIQTD